MGLHKKLNEEEKKQVEGLVKEIQDAGDTILCDLFEYDDEVKRFVYDCGKQRLPGQYIQCPQYKDCYHFQRKFEDINNKAK